MRPLRLTGATRSRSVSSSPRNGRRAKEADVDGEEVFTVEDPKETRLKNYVVGLATKSILGETGDAPALQLSGNRGDVVAPFCGV